MKSLSSKTYQCGVTIQGLTTLSGTVYLTGITNTASWDHVIVGTTAQGQLYTRTYAQIMSDITSGIGLSGYVPTSRTLTINGVSYDLTANRSWTITTPYVSKLQHEVKAGVAINKGQAVYVTGADGTNMIVGLASNASEATSSKTMGLLDATVSTNGFANVVTEGLLAGLDTSTAGAAGDPVWLGTGGNLIYGLGSKPYAPAHLVFIGIVTRKNSNNGEIFVKVQNGFELKEIHDVDLFTTTPVNGHILGFDGTLWVNKTVASWLGYTPANASGTTNYISKFTGSTTLGNSQIYDDGTNVGIGTTSPNSRLSIGGVDNGSGVGVLELFTSGGTNLKLGGNIDYSWIQSHSSKPLRINELGNNVILNLGGGNVGIGTASPGAKLHVGGGEIRVDAGQAIMLDVANTMYLVGGGNQLRLYNGGNPVVNITTGGNVGIGTTSPSEKLDVYGAIKLSGQVANVVTNGIAHHTNGYVYFTGGTAGAAMGNDSYSSAIYAVDNGSLELYAGSANRLHITSGGNVGIGTTSPATALQVNGTARATRLNSTGGTVDFDAQTGNNFIQIASSIVSIANGGNVNMTITSAGNVGIGTTSPTGKLQIADDGPNALVLGSTQISTIGETNDGGYPGMKIVPYNSNIHIGISSTNDNKINLWYGGNNYTYWQQLSAYSVISNYSTNALVFQVNGGNVGIGTTSPVYKLDVNGIGNFSNGFSNPSSETGYRLKFYDNGGTYNDTGIGLDGSGGGGEIMWFNALGGFYWGLGTGGTKMKLDSSGNLGIGIISPTTPLHVSGIIQVEGGGSTTFYGTDASGSYARNFGTQLYTFRDAGGSVITSINTTSGVITTTGGNSTNWNTAYGWGNHASANYVPQARTLTINGTSYDLSANRSWTIATTTPGGSDTQVQYNSSGSLAGASALTYNSTTNRVGINQASPGYDLDVNGQVRVQDKLRVGTGNGVVHMSSTATINASATTVVWAQTVSVGMCAFIEYYILNSTSLTDQRAGTIMVTWNQSGTPTITHTETTTPDIGSTTTVNFTSSLVGSDARINAVNSSANPYTMVMSYKYF